jgi:hypothetical protein
VLRLNTAAQASSVPAAGSGLKLLAMVLVCLGVAGAAVIGGFWYVAHRVKMAVVQKANENGVNLHSIIPPSTETTNRNKAHRACDLLSKEEAARILGQPIEHTEYKDEGCMYYAPAGVYERLAQDQAAETFNAPRLPAPNRVGAMIEGLDAGGQTRSGGEMPLLMLIVSDENAKSTMVAQNATNALFSGILKDVKPDARGEQFGADQGIGRSGGPCSKLGLNVLQRDTFIHIIAGPVPDADAKSIDLARLVLKRL